MDKNLEAIRRQLEHFGHRDRRFRYPEAFRKQVVRYAREQLPRSSKTQLSKRVGIPWGTIARWIKRSEGRKSDTSLVPVRIAAPEIQKEPPVSMVTPGGWRIEGLSVDQTCRILERMR